MSADDGTYVGTRGTGVRQGDRLGSLLFSVAIRPALTAASERHPDGTVLGHLNKGTLIHARVEVNAAKVIMMRRLVAMATGRLGSAEEAFMDQVLTCQGLQTKDTLGVLRFCTERLPILIARGNTIAIEVYCRGAKVVGYDSLLKLLFRKLRQLGDCVHKHAPCPSEGRSSPVVRPSKINK